MHGADVCLASAIAGVRAEAGDAVITKELPLFPPCLTPPPGPPYSVPISLLAQHSNVHLLCLLCKCLSPMPDCWCGPT